MNEILNDEGQIVGYDEPAFIPNAQNGRKLAIFGGKSTNRDIDVFSALTAASIAFNTPRTNLTRNCDYVRPGATAKQKAKRRKAVKKSHKRK